MRLYGAAPIRIKPPAVSLLQPIHDLSPVPQPTASGLGGRQLIKKRHQTAAAGMTTHGAGRLIVVGDQHVFTNMATEHGIAEGYNKEFLARIVEHLAQQPLPGANDSFEQLELPGSSNGSTILFATDGGAMAPLPGLTFLATYLAKLGHRIWQGQVHSASDVKWGALNPDIVFWAVPVSSAHDSMLTRLAAKGGPLLVLVGDG